MASARRLANVKQRSKATKKFDGIFKKVHSRVCNGDCSAEVRILYQNNSKLKAIAECPVKLKYTMEDAGQSLYWGRPDNKEYYVCQACGFLHLGHKSDSRVTIERMLNI